MDQEVISDHVDEFNRRVSKVCDVVNATFSLNIHVDLVNVSPPRRYDSYYFYYLRAVKDDMRKSLNSLINQLSGYNLIGPTRLNDDFDWQDADHLLNKVETRISKY